MVIINWASRYNPGNPAVCFLTLSVNTCKSGSFSPVNTNSTSQILLSLCSFFVAPIRKTECMEKRTSSSLFIALTSTTLANGVRRIEESMCITKSIGTGLVLMTVRLIKFSETCRFLLVDRKLLNASNLSLLFLI